MELLLEDRIAALASPPGPASRGIIRLTGPQVAPVFRGWFEADDPRVWASPRLPRRHPGRLFLPPHRVELPVALHYWPTPRSYTGQPMIEIHTVGSPPLLEEILAELYRRDVRPARRGEFTLRAFLAGRMDLVRAEAVLGVIEAHDHQELETALKQLAGGISDKIAAVRENLILLLADLEAGLDFVEEDIEFVSRADLLDRLADARARLEEYLRRADSRMHSAEKPRVVLAGLPNAGKSSLFNALTEGQAALVSPARGTTRDYLAASITRNGFSLELIDTAGWEELDEGIEAAAQSHRHRQSLEADLILWCTPTDPEPAEAELDTRLLTQLRQQFSRPILPLRTKADRPESTATGESAPLPVSIHRPDTLDALLSRIRRELTATHRGQRELLGSTAARCRESLHHSIESIRQAAGAAELGLGDEITALELRAALHHLARILGEVHTDDLLDQIFSKFCIGK
jgi:tRNA modification GTPase